MTSSSGAIRVVSSMATKALLTELVGAYEAKTGSPVALESVGGVDAVGRVRAGEPFDVVVLARDAIDRLRGVDRLAAGSVVDLVASSVAVAARSGGSHPQVHSEDALRQAVVGARCIGISTGPSGVALWRLFERWGISDQIRDRIVTASPGISVGSLVACGDVDLGFQQHSELLGIDGIDVLGMLPRAVQIVTTFSAAVTAASGSPDAASALVSFLASAEVADAKRRHGLQPL